MQLPVRSTYVGFAIISAVDCKRPAQELELVLSLRPAPFTDPPLPEATGRARCNTLLRQPFVPNKTLRGFNWVQFYMPYELDTAFTYVRLTNTSWGAALVLCWCVVCGVCCV